jgi:catabolite regulation protein CreA
MPSFSASSIVLTIAVILLLANPAHAFGAGNIASVAKIEGLNCEYLNKVGDTAVDLLTCYLGRHGDIEDTLLNIVMSRAAGGKKFGKMDVARVYFGNWLRDYCKFYQNNSSAIYICFTL